MLYWRQILLTLSNLLVGHQVFCFCVWCVCVSGVCGCGMFWNRYLSLEVAKSIPAWSTIICRFLYGFICVFMGQRIKIKPTNTYIPGAGAQFKINIHRFWNWHLCSFAVLYALPCARASKLNKQNAASNNQFLGWEFHRRKPNFETRLYLWLAYIC